MRLRWHTFYRKYPELKENQTTHPVHRETILKTGGRAKNVRVICHGHVQLKETWYGRLAGFGITTFSYFVLLKTKNTKAKITERFTANENVQL